MNIFYNGNALAAKIVIIISSELYLGKKAMIQIKLKIQITDTVSTIEILSPEKLQAVLPIFAKDETEEARARKLAQNFNKSFKKLNEFLK